MAFLITMATVVVAVVGSTFVGAYFWIPAWYGWASLIIGILASAILIYLAYQGYLFFTFQGPYARE